VLKLACTNELTSDVQIGRRIAAIITDLCRIDRDIKVSREAFDMLPLKSTILCIDAESADLARRRMLLEANHYKVFTAASREKALELFFAHFVDAIVIGEHTEGIDASDICARMKQAKPHVPIMLLSRYWCMSESALRYIDAFVYQGRPESAFLASLDRMLHLSSGFFSRWLDNWKFRVATRQLEDKRTKAA
jgi:CheY-like chemotaxis protein